MKYIVNESKFKDFLRNKFNFDLTGKIKMKSVQELQEDVEHFIKYANKR